jgi:ribose 5-phosphate isomerase A
LNLIKGRGAAQTREKIVANAADRFIVLIDESKQVARLGQQMPVPVEVVPMAVGPVSNLLRSCGAEPNLRMGAKKDGPVVTDQGLWIIDATFESGIEDADTVAQKITHEPGVLEHGLFIGLATEVLVGMLDGTVSRRVRPIP